MTNRGERNLLTYAVWTLRAAFDRGFHLFSFSLSIQNGDRTDLAN
jgi:hypothetical protein